MSVKLNRYTITTVLFLMFILCIDFLTISNIKTKIFDIYKEKDYEQVVSITKDNNENKDLTIYQTLNTKIKKIDNKVNEYIGGKLYFVSINGYIQNILNKKIINDADKNYTVFKLNNSYLTFLYPKVNVSKHAEALFNLKTLLANKNIPLIYVQVPFKIDKYNSQLPIGLYDTTNQNADDFLQIIDGKIDYIDLRDEIYKSGLNHYELFFKTDHHWKPETAFWAYTRIRNILVKNYEFNINKSFSDINNYNIKKYKNYFLGSQGKRVGLYYGGVDDISLIYPKFETDIVFEIPSKKIFKSGDFTHTMFDYKQIENVDYMLKNPYSTYTGGDFPLNIIKNKKSNNSKKILLIKDSFSCPLVPFLSLDCSQLHIIDLRYYREGSVIEYINNNKFDIVMVIYNPSALSNNQNQFKFI